MRLRLYRVMKWVASRACAGVQSLRCALCVATVTTSPLIKIAEFHTYPKTTTISRVLISRRPPFYFPSVKLAKSFDELPSLLMCRAIVAVP